jgi:hypothetical protein
MSLTYFVVRGQLFSIAATFIPRYSVNKKRSHEEKEMLKEGEDGCKSLEKLLLYTSSNENIEGVLKPKVSDNPLPPKELSINSIIDEFFSGENHSNSQSIPDDRLPSKKRKFVEIVN